MRTRPTDRSPSPFTTRETTKILGITLASLVSGIRVLIHLMSDKEEGKIQHSLLEDSLISMVASICTGYVLHELVGIFETLSRVTNTRHQIRPTNHTHPLDTILNGTHQLDALSQLMRQWVRNPIAVERFLMDYVRSDSPCVDPISQFTLAQLSQEGPGLGQLLLYQVFNQIRVVAHDPSLFSVEEDTLRCPITRVPVPIKDVVLLAAVVQQLLAHQSTFPEHIQNDIQSLGDLFNR